MSWMNLRTFWCLGGIACLSLAGAAAGCQRTESAQGAGESVPAPLVADYIHTVIEADRATYATQVVQRLQDEEGVLKATEHFKEDKTLPLPAQMLRMGAQRASSGGGLRYSLISKWAINKANLPRTDFERRGLDAVIANRNQPFTEYQTVSGKRYFMALYPDIAVSPACVKCHNEHEQSPRHDFQEGDVMGGLVIAVPVSE
jgi:hypothetical protein